MSNIHLAELNTWLMYSGPNFWRYWMEGISFSSTSLSYWLSLSRGKFSNGENPKLTGAYSFNKSNAFECIFLPWYKSFNSANFYIKHINSCFINTDTTIEPSVPSNHPQLLSPHTSSQHDKDFPTELDVLWDTTCTVPYPQFAQILTAVPVSARPKERSVRRRVHQLMPRREAMQDEIETLGLCPLFGERPRV